MKLLITVSFAALTFALAGAAQTAVAQTNSGAGGGASGTAGAFIVNSQWLSTGARSVGGGSVTSEPYSAEQVTERVQTLADGTHITQPGQKTVLYRDSQGRTRTEHTIPLPPGAVGASGPTHVDIFDPVAGVMYTLEPHNKTAHKISFPSVGPPPPQTISSPPAELRSGGFALGPPVSAAAPDNDKQRPQRSHESLGTQVIEGISAEGSRTTVVYPVGALGNDRPITVTTETWRSPELNLVVLSKSSDPRNGDSTTKLTNISRAEPDPALFQVPSDYEVIEPPETPQR
jgi:hypothetical protein